MLEQKYQNEIIPKWVKERGYANPMSVPRIEKVVVNMGIGQAKDNKAEIGQAFEDLKVITGQAPIIRKAKKSIAGFLLREGMEIGAKVTLRRKRMYQFLEKLFHLVLPRVRDFRGLSLDSFDGQGNYTLGLEEQVVFLEIDPNKIKRRRGFEVTIVTDAEDDQEAKELLTEMGLPLEEELE